MAKRVTSRKNLFGIGETHHHYRRSASGVFVPADKRTPKRKAAPARAKRKRSGSERYGSREQIWKSKHDRESVFESKKERDRFDRSMRSWPNPKKKRNDVIDDAVAAAEGITGTLYQGLSIPYDATLQAGKIALQGKDALKRKLGLNKKKTGRRNPEAEADRLFEKFHGKEPEETVIVEDRIHYHANLATLGALVAIVIDTPTGKEATITFDNPSPYLCSSEDGRQLYIEAGDQKIDLKSLGMHGAEWVKDRMVLGIFAEPRGKRKWNITYQTEKKFDEFELIDYQHDLGEPAEGSKVRKETPYLEYEPRNRRLFISGGNYIIHQPMLGMSPGIEN